MIGRRGERGSGISVLAARHDDDEIYDLENILLITFSNERNLILLHTDKLFQELECLIKDLIKHQSFVYTVK